MRPRLPSLRPFSVAVGLLAGVVVALLAPYAWPGAPVTGVELGVLAVLTGWVALEQAPALVDRALLAHAHYAVGAVTVLTAVGLVALDRTDAIAATDSTRLPALVLSMAGLVVVAAGASHAARVRRARETNHATVRAVEPRRRRWAVTLLAFGLVYGGLGFVYPEYVSPAGLVGIAVGGSLGALLVGRQRVELVVLDSGVFVGPERQLGSTVVPWWRFGRIGVDGDTLTVHRGLPWSTVYEVDLATVTDREGVVAAFRSRGGRADRTGTAG